MLSFFNPLGTFPTSIKNAYNALPGKDSIHQFGSNLKNKIPSQKEIQEKSKLGLELAKMTINSLPEVTLYLRIAEQLLSLIPAGIRLARITIKDEEKQQAFKKIGDTFAAVTVPAATRYLLTMGGLHLLTVYNDEHERGFYHQFIPAAVLCIDLTSRIYGRYKANFADFATNSMQFLTVTKSLTNNPETRNNAALIGRSTLSTQVRGTIVGILSYRVLSALLGEMADSLPLPLSLLPLFFKIQLLGRMIVEYTLDSGNISARKYNQKHPATSIALGLAAVSLLTGTSFLIYSLTGIPQKYFESYLESPILLLMIGLADQMPLPRMDLQDEELPTDIITKIEECIELLALITVSGGKKELPKYFKSDKKLKWQEFIQKVIEFWQNPIFTQVRNIFIPSDFLDPQQLISNPVIIDLWQGVRDKVVAYKDVTLKFLEENHALVLAATKLSKDNLRKGLKEAYMKLGLKPKWAGLLAAISADPEKRQVIVGLILQLEALNPRANLPARLENAAPLPGDIITEQEQEQKTQDQKALEPLKQPEVSTVVQGQFGPMKKATSIAEQPTLFKPPARKDSKGSNEGEQVLLRRPGKNYAN